MDVREVHLDHGKVRGQQGIAQGNAGVGQPSRVDQDPPGPGPGLLEPIQQLPLVIRLEAAHLDASCLALGHQGGVDLLEGGGPVRPGLPAPEQIEVRPMHHQDPVLSRHGGLP